MRVVDANPSSNVAGTAPAPQVTNSVIADKGRQDVTDGCQAAFRAGWHAVELYASKLTARELNASNGPTPADDELIPKFVINWPPSSEHDTQQLLEADVAQCIAPPPPAQDGGQPPPADPAAALDISDVPTYMENLAAQLLVKDYRLSNAFVIGVQLASLATDAKATFAWLDDVKNRDQLTPALRDLAGKIRDLKSCFQPYACDAVATTLLDWNEYAFGADAKPIDPPFVYPQLVAQGKIWRALLSGQKLAQDQIQLADYIDGIDRLTNGVFAAARALITVRRGIILGSLLVVVLGGLIASLIFGKTAGVYTAGLSALAAIGISGTTVTAAVKRAVDVVGDSLWQAELGYAIADATSQVPPYLFPDKATSHVSKLKKRQPSAKPRSARTPPAPNAMAGWQPPDGSVAATGVSQRRTPQDLTPDRAALESLAADGWRCHATHQHADTKRRDSVLAGTDGDRQDCRVASPGGAARRGGLQPKPCPGRAFACNSGDSCGG
jgi:hypothetical protein